MVGLLPFAGILLCIALGPNLFPHFWHRHEYKIISFWSALALLATLRLETLEATLLAFGHMLTHEYIPFVVLIGALFIITNGLKIDIHSKATPMFNVLFMLFGCILANFIGTTGAAMLLIRPLLHANHHQKSVTHVVFFFILLVANVGGCLTPIGDPPLFLGYLNGVSFLWPLLNLYQPALLCVAYLLMIMWYIDFSKQSTTDREALSFRVTGKIHSLFLITIALSIFFSGKFKDTHILGLSAAILRDIIITLSAITSLIIQKKRHIAQHWGPLSEVVRVFIGIFTCLIPVSFFLKSHNFPDLTSDMYFWLTGSLSAVFDNAPTYLFFFKLAGGDAHYLMAHKKTLIAISLGAVFFGAVTYIGNAPNFMVRAIARQSGVAMPSFMGYIGYALIVLLPIFLLIDWFFIH